MALIDHTQLFNRFELLIWEIKNSDKIKATDLPNNILKKIDSNKSQLKKNHLSVSDSKTDRIAAA